MAVDRRISITRNSTIFLFIFLYRVKVIFPIRGLKNMSFYFALSPLLNFIFLILFLVLLILLVIYVEKTLDLFFRS